MRLFLSLFSVLLTQLSFYFFHTTKNMEITRRMSKLDLTPIIIVRSCFTIFTLSFQILAFFSCCFCFCFYIRTINDGYLIFLIFFFNFIGGILINLVKIDCVFLFSKMKIFSFHSF